MTANEVLKAADLDHEVVKSPIMFTGPDGAIAHHPSMFVTRYENEATPLGVVSDDYKIVQNSDAFRFFDPFVSRSKAIYETAGALGTGALVWLLAKMPESVEIAGDSPLEQYILLVNSHDASRAVTAILTNVRVVCQNTMTMALGNKKAWTCRHVSNVLERMDDAACEAFGLQVKSSTTQANAEFERLLSANVTVQSLEKYFDQVARPKDLTDEERAEKDRSAAADAMFYTFQECYAIEEDRKLRSAGTWYAAYNAVTDALDHSGLGVRGKDKRDQMSSLMFGNLAYRKDRALELALAGAANS